MINESTRILREIQDMKQKLDFRYIIVDEYQDISRQRFDLTRTLADVTDAKIIAVGDDWQSIYAFSGSDITLFTHFEKSMGYARLLKIVKTYRNSQEVIDIAGGFIQKNKEQISKRLISPKNITDPVIIYTYDATHKKKDADRRSGADYELANAVETAIGQIIAFAQQENKRVGSVLLLGRFGFDGDRLEKTGAFEYIRQSNGIRSLKYPKVNISFMTVHASKGLGYDNVIVLNGKNETYGFPSKIEDDPILSFVIRGDHSIDYAEERRLFYVAMTRTKNRVFFIAPEQNPSEFLLEIKRDYKNVKLQGEWNEDEPQNLSRKTCPLCGFPLQFRYKKAYGLRLHMCTNEPELCGFLTNEYRAGKLSIMKCDSCRDGYLIVKPGKDNQYFLGCTNYKKSGSGCNNFLSRQQYYRIMGYELENEVVQSNELPSNTSESLTKPRYVKPAFVPNRSDGAEDLMRPELAPILYKGRNLNDVVFTVLNALQHISEIRYYGVHMMLDVLRGSSTERLVKAELQNIPEYGAFRDISREEASLILDWMLENHLMLKTTGRYPVLHPTPEGNSYHTIMTESKLEKLRACLEDLQVREQAAMENTSLAEDNNTMKYLVIGAGGTGGGIGTFLSAAGKDVTMIARGEHLREMQEKGMTLETVSGTRIVPVKAMAEQDYRETPDVIFVCVKGYSLDSILPLIKRVAGKDTIVIPILNIYGTGGRLQRELPEFTVTDGCIYIAAQIKRNGCISMQGDIFRVVFGLRRDASQELRSRVDERLRLVEQDLKDAKILPIFSENVERDCLQKFSFVSPMAALGAAYKTLGKDYQVGGPLRQEFVSLVKEIHQLSLAMGVGLPDNIVDINLKIMDDLTPDATASMQRDIDAGRPSEVDGLVYQVLRYGKEFGVDMPVYEKTAELIRERLEK